MPLNTAILEQVFTIAPLDGRATPRSPATDPDPDTDPDTDTDTDTDPGPDPDPGHRRWGYRSGERTVIRWAARVSAT
jgi:hypothetical protein